MRRLILLSAIAATLLATRGAQAQVPYSVTHGQVPYQAFSGGTVHPPVAYGAFGALDEGAAAIPIPFTFSFFGRDYTTVYAYTNGFLSFSAPTTMGILGPPRTVPSPTNTIHDYIGVLWQDLNGSATSSIRSRVTGASGARVLEIQYEGFERNNAPPGTTGVSFQVRLYETSNSIEIVYGPNFGIVGATAALENFDGSEGINLMDASATCLGSCVCAPRQCSSINFGGTGGRTILVELPNRPEVQGTLRAPPGAFAGASFDVNLSVLNAGLAPAGAFAYEVRLSSSNTSVVGAELLDSFTVPGGLPGVSSFSSTVTLTVPPGTPIGDYYVALVVDPADAVTEVDETNNVAFSGLFRTGPELTGEVTGPTETGPGEQLDVQLDLRSEGAPVTGPVSVQFYLSPSQTVGPGSVAITPPALVTLPDGFSTSQTVTLTAPLTIPPSPPSYFVLADVDPANAIAETDETNNLLVSPGTLDVRGPDLTVDSFDGDEFGFRGVRYPLTTTLSNVGAATARDFTVCVLLSADPQISASDRRLYDSGLVTLVPGETRTLRLEPTIPADTSTGAWHIGAIADCGAVVGEAAEANNSGRRADPITVIDPAANFSPLAVTTPANAAAGEPTPVTVSVANLGNAAAAATVRIVLSDNPGITTQDTLLFETPSPVTVAPTEEAAVSAWVSLPGDLPTGNYWIGAIVDPAEQVAEIYEDDNARSEGPILVEGADLAIVSPTPPNPVIGNPYAWRFAAAGGPADYTWSAEWDGGAAPAGLSFDPALAELAGTPTEAAEGSYVLTLRVRSGDLSAEVQYNLLVTPPTLPLTVVTSRLPPAVATEPYSVQLVAAGGIPPYEWALGSPGPAGISVASDGTLGGEPQLVGPATFTVVVRDQIGQRASGQLSLDVVDPTASITITTPAVPSGVANEAYQTAFSASGGEQPYTWGLEGALPPGLVFEPRIAQLTGTPTVAGEYPIQVEVRDAMGLLDRNAYILEVYEEGVLRIVTGSNDETQLPQATLDAPYLDEDGEAVRLVAEPPEGVRWMLANGVLPPGLTLQAQSGLIAGTPSQAGAFAFTVLAINEANDLRRRSLVILVEDPRAAPPPETGGCACLVPRPAPGGAFALLGLAGLLSLRRRRQ